jgi:hypothetical protein
VGINCGDGGPSPLVFHGEYSMRIRAELTIEVEAEDFVSAANHQQAMEKVASFAKDLYPNSSLKIKQIKTRKNSDLRSNLKLIPKYTGNLRKYNE